MRQRRTPPLSFDPGAGGAVIDPSGALWAARDTGRIQDPFIRITDYVGNSYVDLDTNIEYLNAVTLGDAIEVSDTARFNVSKTFLLRLYGRRRSNPDL